MASHTRLVRPRPRSPQVGFAVVALALAALVSTASKVTAELPNESDTREFENVPSNVPKNPANIPFEASLNVPPFTPSNVNVSNLVGNEAEVSIATNPTDPLNMVVCGHGPGAAT